MTPAPRRAFAVTAERTWVDGEGPWRSPLWPSEASEPQITPLADLLDRVARAADPKGAGVVLVLASDALPLLGLPDQLDGAEVGTGPLCGDGWKAYGHFDHWTRFWRPNGATVFVVVPAWRGDHDAGLADAEDLAGVTRRLAAYDRGTGAPYAVTPGYSGVLALRHQPAQRSPYWCPDWSRIGDLSRTCVDRRDLAWTADRAPLSGWRHTYDAYAAHLGAAAMVDVASDHLQREGTGVAFDRKMAGYWQITPPAWSHASMPSPLHGAEPGKDGRVWVCTPTLLMLHELVEAGELDYPTVHAAWLAPGTRRLRPWAERLRDAIAALDTSEDAEILRSEMKATYRQFVGWLAKENRICHRPDWRHAIVSQGRASMWRRAWRIGNDQDRWPLAIATDSLTYASDHEDPAAGAPAGLRLGPWALGHFRATSSEPAEDQAAELVNA